MMIQAVLALRNGKDLATGPIGKTNMRFSLVEKDLDEVVYESKPYSVPDDAWK